MTTDDDSLSLLVQAIGRWVSEVADPKTEIAPPRYVVEAMDGHKAEIKRMRDALRRIAKRQGALSRAEIALAALAAQPKEGKP